MRGQRREFGHGNLASKMSFFFFLTGLKDLCVTNEDEYMSNNGIILIGIGFIINII